MRNILSIVILLVTTCVSKGSETCKNLETWCEAVKPDCQEAFVKEKCQKYCGLCQDQDWCEQAKPDCNTEKAKESCPKYCSNRKDDKENDLELCCSNGKLEKHKETWHGDVCRHWNDQYTCPSGCQKKNAGPYCAKKGTANSPCRVENGKDCAKSKCPASHPYLDIDGRHPRFNNHHGDVCRNKNAGYTCPEGCDFPTANPPYCAEKGKVDPCRT